MHQRLSQLSRHFPNRHSEQTISPEPNVRPTYAPAPQPTITTFSESPQRTDRKNRVRVQTDICTSASANYHDIFRIATANRRLAASQISDRHMHQRLSQPSRHFPNRHSEPSISPEPDFRPTYAPAPQPTITTFSESPQR